jgi:predicted DsbA family dithiol-disulfide isomerase
MRTASGAPGGAAAYVIGRVRPEAVTPGNRDWPWAHRVARSQGPPSWGLANPWRLPALHSPHGDKEKGTTACPGPVKNTGDAACPKYHRTLCLRARWLHMTQVNLTYFSDILCMWAYVSQARIDAVKEKFAGDVRIEHRFCSVFGDTEHKIGDDWKDKGGYEGFNKKLREIAQRFPHVELNPDVWLVARPPSSASAHVFLKALQQSAKPEVFERVTWELRQAFFRDARDVQLDVARAHGADVAAIEQGIDSGVGFAGVAADQRDADKMKIEGSPSFVLSEGRQKLYGNVGFRIIEANIEELLRGPHADEASWC